MRIKILLIVSFILLTLCSCNVFKESSKYEFSNGIYKTKVENQTKQKVYVHNEEDNITIYPVKKDESNSFMIDTTLNKAQVYSISKTNDLEKSKLITQTSFDIDFLTIPFKYRPKQKDLPNQFTTNLNGAVFLGHRTDIYNLKYKKNPLSKLERKITHYGLSFGLFSGIGGTAMNPSVTQEQISKEYEGVVWSKGIAGIIGINNFTIGLAIGFDDLLDSNKKHWIYQQKAWYGLAFGLNLN